MDDGGPSLAIERPNATWSYLTWVYGKKHKIQFLDQTMLMEDSETELPEVPKDIPMTLNHMIEGQSYAADPLPRQNGYRIELPEIREWLNSVNTKQKKILKPVLSKDEEWELKSQERLEKEGNVVFMGVQDLRTENVQC